MISQKQKIDTMLKRVGVSNGISNGRRANGRQGGGSSESEMGDADAMDVSDTDMMGPDELERLTMEHKKLYEELEGIKKAFTG